MNKKANTVYFIINTAYNELNMTYSSASGTGRFSILKVVGMTFEQFKANVEAWQEARGIYAHSTPLAQALKAVSEVGELADAVIKGDRDGLKDAIGDAMVCLVGVAKMTGCDPEVRPLFGKNAPENNQALATLAAYYVAYLASSIGYDGGEDFFDDSLDKSIIHLALVAESSDLTLIECCEAAWHEIKDRKGKMVAGGAFVKDGDA